MNRNPNLIFILFYLAIVLIFGSCSNGGYDLKNEGPRFYMSHRPILLKSSHFDDSTRVLHCNIFNGSKYSKQFSVRLSVFTKYGVQDGDSAYTVASGTFGLPILHSGRTEQYAFPLDSFEFTTREKLSFEKWANIQARDTLEDCGPFFEVRKVQTRLTDSLRRVMVKSNLNGGEIRIYHDTLRFRTWFGTEELHHAPYVWPGTLCWAGFNLSSEDSKVYHKSNYIYTLEPIAPDSLVRTVPLPINVTY